MPNPLKYKYFDPAMFSRIANLEMVARLVVEGMISGMHKSPHQGFSVEFAEYRQYMPGDDLRHIDWKVFGKKDRLYLRQYQEETNLKAYILLDCSGSMKFGSTGLTKYEYGAYLSAALSYLMIRQQDAVGLVAFDNEIRKFLAPRSSPQHLKDILVTLEHLQPSERTDTSKTFHDLAERFKRRGLIIVVTDLYDDPEAVMQGLAHFRHKKHEVLLFHILDPSEIDFPYDDLIEFEDMETAARMQVQARMARKDVVEAVEKFMEDYRRRCADHNIDYVRVVTSAPVEQSLLVYLGKRGKLH